MSLLYPGPPYSCLTAYQLDFVLLLTQLSKSVCLLIIPFLRQHRARAGGTLSLKPVCSGILIRHRKALARLRQAQASLYIYSIDYTAATFAWHRLVRARTYVVSQLQHQPLYRGLLELRLWRCQKIKTCIWNYDLLNIIRS